MINRFKKLGLSAAALTAGLLLFVAPPKADARVRFGIGVGVAPPVYAAPVNPYPYGYNYPADPYAYDYNYVAPAPAYAYPAPYYAEPYFSFGWGGHDHDGWRGHEFHEHHEFHGHEGHGRR